MWCTYVYIGLSNYGRVTLTYCGYTWGCVFGSSIFVIWLFLPVNVFLWYFHVWVGSMVSRMYGRRGYYCDTNVGIRDRVRFRVVRVEVSGVCICGKLGRTSAELRRDGEIDCGARAGDTGTPFA